MFLNGKLHNSKNLSSSVYRLNLLLIYCVVLFIMSIVYPFSFLGGDWEGVGVRVIRAL